MSRHAGCREVVAHGVVYIEGCVLLHRATDLVAALPLRADAGVHLDQHGHPSCDIWGRIRRRQSEAV
eukprot:4374281-Pyramimonas_sp.AAC.1